MKRSYISLCSCIICLFLSLHVYADEDCDLTLRDAKKAYDAGNYAQAKKLYDYVVTICGASYGNASSWSQRCQDALNPRLSVSNSNISVGASSGTTSITVSSNCAWKLANTNSSLFSVSRNGDVVSISYSSNPNTTTRSDYFDVVTTDGTKSVRVKINQAAKANSTPYLSVSNSNISVGASSGTTSITVSCNSTWKLTNTSSTLFTVNRSGNVVSISYSSNPNTTTRSDYFDVVTTDGTKSVRITVTQAAKTSTTPYLSVNKTSISASSYGTTEYITVSSNKTWEVEFPSGNMYSVTRNENTLTVKINANTSTESRTDFFNVKTTDGSKTQRITLSQTGKSYSSSSTSSSYATINDVSVDHNVYQNGYKGMKIHVKFDAYNVYNHSIKVCAYFYYQNGSALNGISGSGYITNSGKVSASDIATANYSNTTWNDFTVFMPYYYLNMSAGCSNVSLEGHVGVYDATTGKWLTSEYTKFYFTYSN